LLAALMTAAAQSSGVKVGPAPAARGPAKVTKAVPAPVGHAPRGHQVTAVHPPGVVVAGRTQGQSNPPSVVVRSTSGAATASGCFRPSPVLAVVPGAALIWVYSPYVNTSVEVPLNPAPENLAYPACRAVSDCGDGMLGHGSLCDRSTGDSSAGTCREACRDDGDCDTASQCLAGLDPDGPNWAGCVPR